MFETKNGRVIINARNLELMLIAHPEIEDRLTIVQFNNTGNRSISYGGRISNEAIRKLAEELNEAGWQMVGAHDRIDYALQNAVFKLFHDGKLDWVECDYFDYEPSMARDYEDVIYHTATSPLLPPNTSVKAWTPAVAPASDAGLLQEADALTARKHLGEVA